MKSNPGRSRPAFALFLLWLGCAGAVRAQIASATISGNVSDPSGTPVASATVTIKNTATGEAVQVDTDSAGTYAATNLIPGDYQVSVSAPGFISKTSKVTVAQSATRTADFSLEKSNSATEPSLSSLGFPSTETQANPELQARLNKRSHMLQIHQRLGLITTIPLVATVITGAMAGGPRTRTSSSDRDLHAALGATTAGLYFATAYYAIFAPKIPGTKPEGNVRFHRALAWIHGPGMILTPILGAMAFEQRSKGEKVHGIAKLHGQVAIITAAAYGAAILSVSLKSGNVSRSAHKVATLFGFGRSPASALPGDGAYANR